MSKKTKQKKKMSKKMKIIYTIWGGLLIIFYATFFRYKICFWIDEQFGKSNVSQLTEEEKIEDFEQLYSTLMSSVPSVEETREKYGIDFAARKDLYIQMVKDTNSNAEFFGVLESIATELSSFHTHICFPLYGHLKGLNCFDSERVLSRFGTKSTQNQWFDIIGDDIEKYSAARLIEAAYKDGKYVRFDIEDDTIVTYTLESINGVDARKYIMDHPSNADIFFDEENGMAYKRRLLLNDSYGEELEVVWKDERGNMRKDTLYYSVGAELYFGYGYLYQTREYGTPSNALEMYRDDENKLEYIKIKNFENNSGRELRDYIKNSPYDTLIIDLRSNYGGQQSYGCQYLYPELYKSDVEFTFNWKVPISDANQCILNDFSARMMFYNDKDEEYYYYSCKLKYTGKATQDKKVYYLVDYGTGSAADTYIAMVKENSLGTIIGESTRGEGLGDSYVCSVLKNSGLLFVYYPSICTDEKREYLGTTPDIYLNESVEDCIYRLDGTSWSEIDTYDERLMYDVDYKYAVKLATMN